jgi:hypothetical protein
LIETYATKALVESMLDLENPESFISKTLDNYYTKSGVDDKFVTKASLGGNIADLGIEEGKYVFVPTTQYEKDQADIKEELSKTIKLDGEGYLESVVVG